MLRGALSASLLVGLIGCGRGVRPAECRAMIERYVELRAPVEAPPKHEALPAVVRAEEQCAREITRNEYACAMAAKTANDWEACLE